MLLTRRAAIKGLLVTGIGAATGATTYGVAYERHQIGVTQAALLVSGLPVALDRLRIGLLTDVHHSSMVPAEDVTRAVTLLMTQHPDLIVLGGDYVTFGDRELDRKSTRLNSSHLVISYAVFCLKKKKAEQEE